jgi:hypothetical protein
MIENNDKTFIVPQTPHWTLQPAAAFFTAAFAATRLKNSCMHIAHAYDNFEVISGLGVVY